MWRTAKRIAAKTPLYPVLYPVLRRVRDGWRRARIAGEWARQGFSHAAPHGVKQLVLAQYAKRFGPRVLVETGRARAKWSRRCGSRSTASFDRTEPRLRGEGKAPSSRPDSRIRIIEGDSGKVLREVVANSASRRSSGSTAHPARHGDGRRSAPVLGETELDSRSASGGTHRDRRCPGIHGQERLPDDRETRTFVRSESRHAVSIEVSGDS